jgi:hypothetical protein
MRCATEGGEDDMTRRAGLHGVVSFLAALTMSTVAIGSAAAQEGLTVGTHDDRQGADIFGAIGDSFKLLLIEHGTRIAIQEKTRRELGGNFWRDYARSVRMPQQWTDTDAWTMNYIGHPIHGAAAGYIWLDHKPGAPLEFSTDRGYFLSRIGAMAWIMSYSIQFEIGPLSEASIGNVGMNPKTAGWVDHVVTPIGGVGFMVAEDALDRYVVKWAEQRVRSPFIRIPLRFAANPGRTLANAASGRAPWYRAGRPLDWK